MYAVVTGAAGFVGSHLSEALVEAGHRVRGIDCFTDYYDPGLKLANLGELAMADNFEFVQADLSTVRLTELVDGADVIFHQAGQPGVRSSWANGFNEYCTHNVLATQRLLEAAKVAGVQRFVYASSSSVYGNALSYPTRESDLPRPHSPYGVTKLAAEHLCSLYAANFGMRTVSLRYFTVYGPRQRPDMAMRRLVDAPFTQEPFPLYGNGRQVRDFTYVGDIVRANLAAATGDVAPGSVVNVAGGSHISMLEVIELIGTLAGESVVVVPQPAQAGDVERTGGSVDRAKQLLSWEPTVPISDGLAAMVEWAQGQSVRTSAVVSA